MNTHIKLVGIFHIVLGAMGLIGALVIFTIFGTASGIVVSQGERGAATLIGVVALFIGGLIALFSVPDIIGGWALLAGKSWARVLMIVLGCFDLLHFPLGTALGVYTLWVLLRAPEPQSGYPSASEFRTPS
jgi:hypothetical protein